MTTRLVVLESFPAPRPTTNPYLVQLAGALADHVDVRTFTWRRALTGRYDVLHVHWPENLARGSSRLRTAARQGATALLLARLVLRRTAVVRTLHNTGPHEPGGRVERALLRLVDRRTTLWVRLTEHSPVPTAAPAVTIPHGHYRDWFAGRGSAATPHPGRLLLCGLLRPYKGVEDLLAAFADVDAPDVSLRLVGRPTAGTIRAAVEASVATDPRVSARLEYVAEDDLATEVRAAAVVVLPYRRLHSSGAALLALSLDRPVVLPEGDAARELAAEVGRGWVATFTPPLTADGLAGALEHLAAHPRTARPDLSAREWPAAGAAHAAAFADAVARRRPGRPSAGAPDRRAV